MGSFEHGDLVGGFDCYWIMVVLQSNMEILVDVYINVLAPS